MAGEAEAAKEAGAALRDLREALSHIQKASRRVAEIPAAERADALKEMRAGIAEFQRAMQEAVQTEGALRAYEAAKYTGGINAALQRRGQIKVRIGKAGDSIESSRNVLRLIEGRARELGLSDLADEIDAALGNLTFARERLDNIFGSVVVEPVGTRVQTTTHRTLPVYWEAEGGPESLVPIKRGTFLTVTLSDEVNELMRAEFDTPVRVGGRNVRTVELFAEDVTPIQLEVPQELPARRMPSPAPAAPAGGVPRHLMPGTPESVEFRRYWQERGSQTADEFRGAFPREPLPADPDFSDQLGDLAGPDRRAAEAEMLTGWNAYRAALKAGQ